MMVSSASKGRVWNERAGTAAGWLALAAAPTFALMGLIAGGSMPSALCMSDPGILPFDGMTTMYLLMCLFHLPPWLKRAARGRVRPTTEGD